MFDLSTRRRKQRKENEQKKKKEETTIKLSLFSNLIDLDPRLNKGHNIIASQKQSNINTPEDYIYVRA